MPDSAQPPAASPPVLSRRQIFARRLFSSVLLWTVVLAAVFSPNRLISVWCFFAIMTVISLAGLAEFYGMVEKCGLRCFKAWGIAGGVLLTAGTFFYLSGLAGTVPGSAAAANDFETGFLILFVLGLCVRQFAGQTQEQAIQAIACTLLGLMYVPWLLNFIQKINFYPGVEGRYYVLYFILVTKFSDLGAYVTGSLIGKHKMIPRISPGKTWEGFAGALVISTGASVGFAALAQTHVPDLTMGHAIILGLVLSSAAVIGDLIESIFKRQSGVKDSGRFFPGIGGILDLMDSLLFNAPIMYLYLRFVLV